MSASLFIDSNIWLYSFTGDSKGKHEIASQLIKNNKDDIVISFQVVNEVCFNLIKKADFDEVMVAKLIDSFFQSYRIIDQDKGWLIRGSNLRKSLSLSFWDSLIISAALQGECNILYTEDMQHGQLIENKLRIVNPFLFLEK